MMPPDVAAVANGRSIGAQRISAPAAGRPIRPAAFFGVCVVAFGGPLALAAVYAPSAVEDVTGSAGLVSLAAAVAFGVPLLVWLRWSGRVAGSDGLTGFVRAAAGPRVAGAHAALWIASYALYLVYTTASIVYDLLPAVSPAVRPWRPVLEITIPVALAVIMLAGRSATLAVCAALAVGQLVLVGWLAAVSIGHAAPSGSFALPPATKELGIAAGNVALLYVCGSLPLFLGGELARPARTIRRGMTGAYVLTAIGVTAAVFPLAADPAFTRTGLPGVAVAEVFSGHAMALAIGIGTAASIAGVMLVEYLALSRLVATIAHRPVRPVIGALAAVLVLSAPLTLIAPDRIYENLLKPSLVALWLSQLLVFAVYPRFVRSTARRPYVGYALALGGVLFTLGGLYTSLQSAST